VQSEWAAFRGSLLSHIQDLRIEMLQLRSYCALAMAATDKDRSKFLTAAARDSRRLKKEGLPWTSALSDYILGTIAFLEGDLPTARTRLSAAVSGFDRIDAHLHAAVTRWRLAGIPGCEGASDLRSAAEEWFRRQKIKVPERMVDAYAPGFPR
jgi:hypothetical protein